MADDDSEPQDDVDDSDAFYSGIVADVNQLLEWIKKVDCRIIEAVEGGFVTPGDEEKLARLSGKLNALRFPLIDLRQRYEPEDF